MGVACRHGLWETKDYPGCCDGYRSPRTVKTGGPHPVVLALVALLPLGVYWHYEIVLTILNWGP